PTAARLAATELGTKLGARVFAEELARVDPVRGARGREQRQRRQRRTGRRAAVGPQGEPVGNLAERGDLFDAAVAVGAHDEHGAHELARAFGHAENEIVVELALLPVGEKIVTAVGAN